MKTLSLLSLLLTPVFAFAGCAPVSPTLSSATVPTIRTSMMTPTGMVKLPTNTPSTTITPTPLNTVEPAQVTETLEPLIRDPMNCAVPCFWGIVPEKTSLQDTKVFFSRLGFTSKEGQDLYSVAYRPDSGGGFSVIFYAFDTIVENIVITPYIPEPNKGSPRDWIAYSPETLIKRYGSPSSVGFTVSSYGMSGAAPNIGINMIMYFDTSDLIVQYSGYDMNPKWFCPLTAPFDFVRLWMGRNPPDTPSFVTVPLEKATSLTMDQFSQLMTGNPSNACFSLGASKFP